MNNIHIRNGSVLLPGGLKNVDLEISEGVISDIGAPRGTSPAETIDARGKFVLPGFIDIHTNGIAGFDFTNGRYDLTSDSFASDEENYLDATEAASRAFLRTGVTRAVLSSVAAPPDQLMKVFRLFDQYKSQQTGTPWKDVLWGINIEGSFIKSAAYRGAHNPAYFLEPSVELYEDLQNASGRRVRIVNVAPEWGDSALRLIEHASAGHVVCAAGHTGATGDQYNEAIRRGTRLAVHFLNGPSLSSGKSLNSGGAIESALRAESFYVEIIVDGYHVDKSYVLDIIRRKGFDRTIAITDSMFATALTGLKKFTFLGVQGVVSQDGRYLQIAGREDSLFGSVLTMDRAFSKILTWLTMPIEGVWTASHPPLEFEDALLKTWQLCSRNPAILLGIYSPNQGGAPGTGSIELGKCADIVVAQIERVRDTFALKVDRVIANGSLL